jgi:hypothetical protein
MGTAAIITVDEKV